jgi:hypothetical protein
MEVAIVLLFLAVLAFSFARGKEIPEVLLWCAFGIAFVVFALGHLGVHV